MNRAVIALVGVLAFASQRVPAADITVDPEDADGIATVTVNGALIAGDEVKFRERVGPLSKALVILDSPGGNLLAGVQIGEIIRMKGFVTGVAGTCASACALAWLGGTKRFMTRSSKIGFHAASNVVDATESGVGNAVVGAYATRLGLPYSVVIYITLEGPRSMAWLTPVKAKEVGIDVILHEATPTATASSLPEHAKNVPKMLAEMTSAPATSALEFLANVYAPRVEYFGRTLDRKDVLRDKATFFARWPNRKYIVRDYTQVLCDTAAVCEVSGLMDWRASSEERNELSIGQSAFNFKIRMEPGKSQVLSESSSVVSRQKSRLR